MSIVVSCRFNCKTGGFIRNKILLDDGQVACPRCEGNGYNPKYDTNDYCISDENPEGIEEECNMCNGDGFVDWAKLPFLGGWEEEEQKFQEYIVYEMKMEAEEEDFWDELDDWNNHSSFDIDK